ncbi:DnaB-like helicase C-terminal domain-containing protein [Labilibaculum manganireducens]|uniref:DnaB-like helicase C-terminal domain-containing protein n=1 Tax=Labilibaculum manganireducens TaxID=1940525 RepID=UPI0029F52B64|nr:DnaB-like helicase C-terminal domain-containing protein [Labilibaculum manganireducens]
MPKKFLLANEFVDTELESSLIATIKKKPDIYWEIIDILPSEAWEAERDKFEIIAEAIEQNKPIPALGVTKSPVSDPVVVARELADLYQKRLLADLAQDFLGDLRGNEKHATSLITDLEDQLSSVQQAVKELKASRIISMSDLFGEVVEETYIRHELVKEKGSVVVGLPTGINKLDKLLGGLQTGIHLLAAEPGQGKTTLTMQIAAYIAKLGVPVLFVSFEESLKKLALKALCHIAGLESKKFADGYGDPEVLKEAALRFGRDLSRIYLVEGTSRLTVPHLKAKALQVMTRRKNQKCLIIVDYLQRWASVRREFSDFRHVVSGLVSELRELALRLDNPVMVISSQNRPGQGGSSLTSLKESGDLEYSADTALFLVKAKNRNSDLPARAINLALEKNRYGDKGLIELIFRPDLGTFRELV